MKVLLVIKFSVILMSFVFAMKRKATPLENESKKKVRRLVPKCEAISDVVEENEKIFLYTGKLPSPDESHLCYLNQEDCLAPFTLETFHCHSSNLFRIALFRRNESRESVKSRFRENLSKLKSLLSQFVEQSTNPSEWLETQCAHLSIDDLLSMKKAKVEYLLSFFAYCVSQDIVELVDEQNFRILDGLFPYSYEVSAPNSLFFKPFLSNDIIGIKFFMTIVGDKANDLVPVSMFERFYGVSSFDFSIGYHIETFEH